MALSTWAALVGISAIAVSAAWINHDAAWYLHMSGAWVDGAVLYRDVMDTNSPLVVFVTVLPVLLGRLLHVPTVATFKTLVFAAAILSAAGGSAILRRIYARDESWLLGSSALLFLLLPFVGADFGQREHLTTLMVMPYVLGCAASMSGRPLTRRAELALGLLAGVGLAMKPHFLVAWIALELSVVAVEARPRTWLRPAAIAVAATILLYWLIVLALLPQYFEAAADVLSLYGALNQPAGRMLYLPEIGVCAVAALLVAAIRLPPAQKRACLVVLAAAAGFLLAAVSQLKGWGYHLYPFRVLAGLLFAMMLAALLEADTPVPRAARIWKHVLVAAAITGLVIAAARNVRPTIAPSGIDLARALQALVERERADSLAVLSMRTIVFPAFPVVNYTGARWVMRHNSMWFLPGLYADALDAGPEVPFRSPESMGTLERRYFLEVIDDLCANPPRVLVVEPPPESVRRGFGSLDLVAYYRQDQRFARLFAAYEPRDRFGPFIAYVRPGDASCAGPGSATALRPSRFVVSALPPQRQYADGHVEPSVGTSHTGRPPQSGARRPQTP